jgi:hypothetical protein
MVQQPLPGPNDDNVYGFATPSLHLLTRTRNKGHMILPIVRLDHLFLLLRRRPDLEKEDSGPEYWYTDEWTTRLPATTKMTNHQDLHRRCLNSSRNIENFFKNKRLFLVNIGFNLRHGFPLYVTALKFGSLLFKTQIYLTPVTFVLLVERSYIYMV